MADTSKDVPPSICVARQTGVAANDLFAAASAASQAIPASCR
jgi:hypothetical protein